MWDPCIASTKKHVEDSEEKIVFDKFHVAAHLGKAGEKVRRYENDAPEASDGQREERGDQLEDPRIKYTA
jgi:hypothetical protein